MVGYQGIVNDGVGVNLVLVSLSAEIKRHMVIVKKSGPFSPLRLRPLVWEDISYQLYRASRLRE